jgi:hypothetical protein
MQGATPFPVFSVTYFILRHMLGYIDGEQRHRWCHLMTFGFQV